jgi:Periplasmic binding protein
VLVAGLLFASCSNSGDSTKASSTSAAAAAATTTAAVTTSTAAATTTTAAGGSGGTTVAAATSAPAAATTAATTAPVAVPLTGIPGISDTEIRYAALGTNSNNPLGTCVLDCFADGIRAYFEFRNSQGGIYGRKLVLSKIVDDELGSNQAKALEIISANDTFGTFNAAQISSGLGNLASAGVPVYTWAINPEDVTGHPEIFGNREVNCITCLKRNVAYVAKLAGATKVATLGYGVSANSKQCAQSNADSIDKYSAEAGGAKVVYKNDALAFGLPNGIGPEVTAMGKAGVDFIFACIDLNGMKTLAQELKRQGLRQKVKMLHANTYDADFVAAAAGLFDTDYVAVGFRPFEANPGASQLQDYFDWMKKTGKKQTEIAMDGWINADLAYQGLKAAGPNLSRKAVVEASNTFTAFTAGGLTEPVDWSRQHVAPTADDPATHGPKYECISLVQVKQGKFVMVGDPDKPFTCWPGDTYQWSEPTPMDFK